MKYITFLIILFLFSYSLVLVGQENNTTTGKLVKYSTIRSIGIEWEIEGDNNHNATCDVKYRKIGTGKWIPFYGLFRVDFQGYYHDQVADKHYNMLAGSIMFLDAGSSYEILFELVDPDGGSKDTVIEVSTRIRPNPMVNGNTFFVIPGEGGGDGSVEDPYRGIAAAEMNASPGDVFLLGEGEYGGFDFEKSGAENEYIIWKASGEGDVIFEYLTTNCSYVWFDGIKFVYKEGNFKWAFNDLPDASFNAVTNCNFKGYLLSIRIDNLGSDGWYISDNVIVGDKLEYDPTDYSGEGINIQNTKDHIICSNSISYTADGISCGYSRNCDIYGNDLFSIHDDAIEPDYSYANMRIWQNRLTNIGNACLSIQPMFCGPWYIIRNQVMTTTAFVLKYRVVDRFLLAHNTFVGWDRLGRQDQSLLSAVSRNNLWIQAGGGDVVWEALPCIDNEGNGCTVPDHFRPDWQTDVDYDGFDWGTKDHAFRWSFEGGETYKTYSSLESFSNAVGIEKNAFHLDRNEIFEDLQDPDESNQYTKAFLTLKNNCNAIDRGDILFGINTDYNGDGPDLGAYEYGQELPEYGPRDNGLLSDYFDNNFFAYPNPFSCSIRLRMVTYKTVNWSIFNINGQLITRRTGADWVWDASTYPSGHYVVRSEVDGKFIVKHVLLSK